MEEGYAQFVNKALRNINSYTPQFSAGPVPPWHTEPWRLLRGEESRERRPGLFVELVARGALEEALGEELLLEAAFGRWREQAAVLVDEPPARELVAGLVGVEREVRRMSWIGPDAAQTFHIEADEVVLGAGVSERGRLLEPEPCRPQITRHAEAVLKRAAVADHRGAVSSLCRLAEVEGGLWGIHRGDLTASID